MLKLVLTPAILTKAADCLGKPVFNKAHMSVVVLLCVSRPSFTQREKNPPSYVYHEDLLVVYLIL